MDQNKGMKIFLAIAVLAASLGAEALASTPLPLKGANLLPQTKISLADARHAALAKEHGTITDQELEKENGRLRYSFDVKVGEVTHEVGIDAVTGKVVEDSIDNGKD